MTPLSLKRLTSITVLDRRMVLPIVMHKVMYKHFQQTVFIILVSLFEGQKRCGSFVVVLLCPSVTLSIVVFLCFQLTNSTLF